MPSQAFLPGMRVKRRMTLQGTVHHYIHIREPVSTIGDLHHGKVWVSGLFSVHIRDASVYETGTLAAQIGKHMFYPTGT